MNRNNVLFLVIGILIGFLAGYFLQEEIAKVQPVRRIAGSDTGAATAAPPGAPRMPAAPGAAPAAGAMGGGPVAGEVIELQQRITDNPDDAEAVLGLARLNLQISNWERAAELLQRYLELEPESPNELVDLAVVQRTLAQYDEALSSLDRALELAPDHWVAYYNKAVVLIVDLQRLDDAALVVETMQEMRPEDQDVQALASELTRLRSEG